MGLDEFKNTVLLKNHIPCCFGCQQGGNNDHENRVKHSSNMNADSQNYTPQKSSDLSNQCPRKSENCLTGRKGKPSVVCL